MSQERPKSKTPARRAHPGAGRPAACEVASRIERLLDTAAAVFLEKGYKNANVAEIARRAGASKTTLYARYPAKADLFVAVITRKTRSLQESFAEVLLAGEPLGEVLEAFGMRMLSAMSHPEKRALYRVFLAESPHFPGLAKKFWSFGPARSMQMLSEFLQHHPEFKSAHPDQAAETFWALCCGILVLKAQLQKSYTLPEHAIRARVREAVRVFVAAYAAPSSL